MAPRNPSQQAHARQSSINDDDDIDLDDIETTPHDDDDGGEPEPEPELEPEEDEESDDPELEEPEDDEGEPEPEPQPRARQRANGDDGDGPTRGARRVQRLANENRELRDTNRQLMERFDSWLSQQTQPQTREAQETPAQRQQRREQMLPEERMAEDLADFRKEIGGSVNQSRMQLADQSDRSSFQSTYGHLDVFKRHGAQVEQELAKMRKNGQNASREVVLAYMLGLNNLKKLLTGAGASQRQAAERRVQRQTTRPGNPGSDQPARRTRQGQSREDRLANVKL